MMTSADATACPVVLVTAGHVDHGKSTLVEALTGVNPDRLPVERERGMTTELGFGALSLPSGRCVGLVDVPGHAHYLRAMIQGATGADVVLIAVSALEGVMPQTREHVRILELLGVRHVVVALTMCDLADEETLALSRLDVEEFLHTTSYAEARVIPGSARIGAGLDALKVALDRCVDRALADRSRATDLYAAGPRLPIDRRFTIKGAGTVVTGTLRDGAVRVGDTLQGTLTGVRVRVRGMQVHGDVDMAEPGQRVALNIVGGATDLSRGEVLCVPGTELSTRRAVLRFTYIGRDGSRSVPLESGMHVRVMAGTAEAMGRIMLFEGDLPLLPGGTAAVQIRLRDPLPVRAGDSAIVLAESPISLIGGGTVLLSHCRRSRSLRKEERSLIDALARGDLPEAVAAWLRSQAFPVRAEELCSALDLSLSAALDSLGRLVQAGAAVQLASDASQTCFIAPASLDAALNQLVPSLRSLHAALPDRSGFTPGEVICAAWPAASEGAGEVLLTCARERGLCSVDGAEVFDPRSGAGARRALHDACESLLAGLNRCGLEPVITASLADACGIDRGVAARAMRELLVAGSAIMIGREAIISSAAERRARDIVSKTLADAGGSASTSTLKDALGISRKQAIALLEHFDRVGFTVLDRASGGLRSLRP